MRNYINILLAFLLVSFTAQARVFNSTEEIRLQPATDIHLEAETFAEIVNASDVNLLNQGSLQFLEATANGSESITLQAPAALGASQTYTLPLVDGASGEFLQTNGSGTLIFAAAATAAQVSETVTATQVAFGDGASVISSSADLTFSANELSITSGLNLNDDGYFRIYEAVGNGTDAVTIQVPAALAASYTLTLPPNDGAAGQVLQTDGAGVLTFETVAAGSGAASQTVEFERFQGTHGFAQLDAIYYDKAETKWKKAQADDSSTLSEYVVVSVADASNFTAAKFGEYAIAHGLPNEHEHYFLSEDTLGGNSVTEGASFSCPIFKTEGASLIHIGVHRCSKAVGFGALASRYHYLVGNAADVAAGAADFDALQTAINFATTGNKIILLPDRTFTETITVNKKVLIEGFGASSVISGTVTFTATTGDESGLSQLKVAGDITINSDAVRIKDIDQRTGDTINNLGTDNIVRDVIVR